MSETEAPKKKRNRRKDPFIALHFRAMEDGAKAARSAGVHEDVVLAGLPRMWQHCWRKKTDRVHVNELDSFFTIVGLDQANRLRAALGKNGFLELSDAPDGDRVKGAAELLRIADSRSRGGHAAKGNLLRGTAKSPAPAGHLPGSTSGSSPALSATSYQPPAIKLPPNPPLREGGGSEKPPRLRRRDREPPPESPPRLLGWAPDTPAGKAWRERLDALSDAYAVAQLEKLRPAELAEAGCLVVTGDDRYFVDWCKEHYGGLLEQHQVLIVGPSGGTSPPQLKLVGGGTS